jgi:hypothetical protein
MISKACRATFWTADQPPTDLTEIAGSLRSTYATRLSVVGVIGVCIYCGECDATLGTEHAVPYGLNGPWTLHRASCESCAKITSHFEHDVMRSLWPDVRNALAMQSRRKDKRSFRRRAPFPEPQAPPIISFPRRRKRRRLRLPCSTRNSDRLPKHLLRSKKSA